MSEKHKGNRREGAHFKFVPPEEPKPDRRSLTPGHGQQGEITCPGCGATVTLRKWAWALDEPETKGMAMISPHRVGGGRYSATRGDARCRGSDTPA